MEIFPIARALSPYAQQWGEHSYAVFNRLVAQERAGMKRLDMNSAFSMPWKNLALCYVALVTTPQKNAQAPFQLHPGSRFQFMTMDIPTSASPPAIQHELFKLELEVFSERRAHRGVSRPAFGAVPARPGCRSIACSLRTQAKVHSGPDPAPANASTL